MGIFGGDSSSSSTTQNFDKRLAVDSGAAISGDGSSIVINTTAIDGGTVKLGGEALTLARDSVSGAGVVVMEGMRTSAKSIQGAIDAATSATNNALAAATSATRDAIDMAAKNTALTIQANTTAMRDSYDFSSRNNKMLYDTAAEAMGMVSHSSDSIIKTAADFGKRTEDVAGNAINQVARAYDTATNYQAEKSTTDNRYLITAALAAVAVVAIRAFK